MTLGSQKQSVDQIVIKAVKDVIAQCRTAARMPYGGPAPRVQSQFPGVRPAFTTWSTEQQSAAMGTCRCDGIAGVPAPRRFRLGD